MTDALAQMLATLALTDDGARTREDISVGPSERSTAGRVFGGQVLGQVVVAASRTVDPERPIHSLHGYFLRPGDDSLPITFAVDRIHDGRSFSTRRTQAYQRGVPIFSAIASFQTVDAGVEHAATMPAGIPAPESLRDEREVLEELPDERAHFIAASRAFDLRHVQSSLYPGPDPVRRSEQAVWMRTIGPMPDDPVLHRAAIAYASDYTILEPVMRRHGVTWGTPGARIASLDHAMWWHRPARADEWLLYAQESSNAIGGRGLASGRIFDRDGALVASVTQEGMIRVSPPASAG